MDELPELTIAAYDVVLGSRIQRWVFVEIQFNLFLSSGIHMR